VLGVTAQVSSRAATASALAIGGAFVGPVHTRTAVLVQIKDIYSCVVATAWAIAETGMAELSCGPAPKKGGTISSCQPQPNTAITFIDAVTGKLISEAGFPPRT
jgi:hypothetical protein